ncbi:MAG: exonuclease domain-containing protein [Saccharofermentans sp.]|nr:exonuclease domain-containing protein [Saccharofermentans sp.]
MLNRKITNGDIFIVFDMEWNQPLPGKEYPFEVSALTGEIIEIGAVKYVYESGTLIEKDHFSYDIKPVCYRTIHYHVKKVTHKTNDDLKNGKPFEEVYRAFKEFCGENAILVGWGNSDTDMLKMNLKFFGLDDYLGMYFLDIQPLFSVFSTEKGKQRSVEFAVDYYEVPKIESFHSATSDAKYTGAIFKNIIERNDTCEVINAIEKSTLDPDIKREYTEVGAACPSVSQAFSMLDGFCCMCPICSDSFDCIIPNFRIRKSAYGLFECKEHGVFFGRTRVRKNKSGNYYASAVLRFATQTELFLVESKKEEYDLYGIDGAPVVIKEQSLKESE